jgi:hypothetical protein
MANDLIPSDIREIYEPLFHDVCHLHRKWKLFCELYASGESVVELLNKSAPGFFRICQDLLVDDVLISISRLMDQKQTFGKDNLTLDRLVHSIDTTNYPQLRQDVERLFCAAGVKSAFAKDQRNKRIAHSDLSTKLQASLISSPTKMNVEDALKAIRDVMNAVELHFNTPLFSHGVNVAYVEYSSPFYADAQQLMARLQGPDS